MLCRHYRRVLASGSQHGASCEVIRAAQLSAGTLMVGATCLLAERILVPDYDPEMRAQVLADVVER